MARGAIRPTDDAVSETMDQLDRRGWSGTLTTQRCTLPRFKTEEAQVG